MQKKYEDNGIGQNNINSDDDDDDDDDRGDDSLTHTHTKRI